MTELWSQRAAAYRDSDAHREGPDLDAIAEWAFGAETALDVATGGGPVARRLRENGTQVVTCDAAPGMAPDVVCAAESLPFADASFDVVTCRVAAHHFADPAAAVKEMARVARFKVLIADTMFMGESVEKAEKLRDPSHVRNYTESEWRGFCEGAGLSVGEVRITSRPMAKQAWLDRTGCTGETGARALAYLGDRVVGDGIVFDRISIKGLRP
ncbi:MAG: class I SAM-dependent methyltransferase [Gaiella sp.]